MIETSFGNKIEHEQFLVDSSYSSGQTNNGCDLYCVLAGRTMMLFYWREACFYFIRFESMEINRFCGHIRRVALGQLIGWLGLTGSYVSRFKCRMLNDATETRTISERKPSPNYLITRRSKLRIRPVRCWTAGTNSRTLARINKNVRRTERYA